MALPLLRFFKNGNRNLKAFANLKKNVLIRGVGNKAEIWDAQAWTEYKKTKVNPSLDKFSKIFDL